MTVDVSGAFGFLYTTSSVAPAVDGITKPVPASARVMVCVPMTVRRWFAPDGRNGITSARYAFITLATEVPSPVAPPLLQHGGDPLGLRFLAIRLMSPNGSPSGCARSGFVFRLNVALSAPFPSGLVTVIQ